MNKIINLSILGYVLSLAWLFSGCNESTTESTAIGPAETEKESSNAESSESGKNKKKSEDTTEESSPVDITGFYGVGCITNKLATHGIVSCWYTNKEHGTYAGTTDTTQVYAYGTDGAEVSITNLEIPDTEPVRFRFHIPAQVTLKKVSATVSVGEKSTTVSAGQDDLEKYAAPSGDFHYLFFSATGGLDLLTESQETLESHCQAEKQGHPHLAAHSIATPFITDGTLFVSYTRAVLLYDVYNTNNQLLGTKSALQGEYRFSYDIKAPVLSSNGLLIERVFPDTPYVPTGWNNEASWGAACFTPPSNPWTDRTGVFTAGNPSDPRGWLRSANADHRNLPCRQMSVTIYCLTSP